MALAVLDLPKAIEFSQRDLNNGTYDESEFRLLEDIGRKRGRVQAEQEQFAAACDHWDSLYYPSDIGMTANGASHWWYHSSAKLPGRAHVSVNTPPIYVDIPAALQSVAPIRNLVPLVDSEDARTLAAMTERLFTAWIQEIDLDLKGHKGCVVKGLYGRTAGKVYWDEEVGFPQVEVVEQPRNLWMGWGQSDYRTLDWACYTYRITPEEALSQYGLVCVPQVGQDGESYPYLMPYSTFDTWSDARQVMWAHGEIEVTDYWFRQPRSEKVRQGAKVKPVKHDTWNAIIVGNRIVQSMKFPEYDGKIPYIPLFNSFIPGMPSGRPELYDIEQLIREKDERLTSGSQLMHNTVNSQYWQLTGQDAPDSVPAGLRPKPNQVIAPGAGNRVEAIQPWMPEFQLESFLARIDKEMIDVSGLNDLLRGLAPASVMSSSKAINALVANYEMRIRLKRDLYYRWQRDIWEMARRVWAQKVPDMEGLLIGSGMLQLQPPSLTPRDDMETAQIARTLVDGKLWSMVRGMDRTGVDDPEAEQNAIRAEQTDASLNPASVQVMAAVAQQLQAMGFANAEQALQGIAPEQGGGPMEEGGGGPMEEGGGQEAMMADMRAQLGGGEGTGVAGSGEGPIPAQEAMPGNTPEGAAVGAGPPMEPGSEVMAQTMVKGGEASNRLMFQQPIEGGPPPEEA